MIHFIIPSDKLSKFPYAPLFNNDIQLPPTKKDFMKENEVLLPPYCKFQLVEVSEQELPLSTWGFNETGGLNIVDSGYVITTVYTLTFVSPKVEPVETQR